MTRIFLILAGVNVLGLTASVAVGGSRRSLMCAARTECEPVGQLVQAAVSAPGAGDVGAAGGVRGEACVIAEAL